ncbi:MAG: hypothetical protein EON93_03730 [Burkholderiales bacterium]|nr:MAG: hypothetical protein EON93_03730 [Burkholderiales bacterium]
MAEPDEVLRSLVVKVLDDSPSFRTGNLRYADHISYLLARDQVVDMLVSELRGNGFLPFDAGDAVLGKANFHAVAYTMKQMRSRLVKHIRGGGRDTDAEREWTDSVATAFFGDLEAQGWRLVRTTTPLPMGAHYQAPGYSGAHLKDR